VLSPFEDSGGVSLKNPHDATVSTKLIYGDTSLLFMGDAEKEIEYRLVAEEGMGLQSDILKVGHHGSKTSSAEVFLRAVWPEIAVISVGRKNRYGHPHQEVLDRLSAMGIQVLRTDVEGDLKFVSDGTISEVEPH
jgi:beta-lactamase superfamily II metal-dependent hydrolase